ncbi:sugar transferase [Cytobacillus massiliigabonensis]|uniref:sugar transferase n=1 Tax=Cytobacillus massiliigabonensis TaxID=1871011 RepID=UPI000C856403|nr:sugar transferase [Cytobacillus massiliigabonensis]
MKRIFDLVASSFCFLLFCPLIILTAILVRMKLGSPIVYKQERPGLNGQSFVLYKFRTMTDEYDINGDELPDHLRVTSFGNFLRRYSLDEFPQLFNVLKGDISLVGPRPLKMEYLPLYSKFQARRHEVKPGITGWAQVNGRNGIPWENRFELDVWYVDNRSFILDIKIILMTIRKLLKPEGINQEGHVTMPEFKGNRSQRSIL